jgi:hypothetical protein
VCYAFASSPCTRKALAKPEWREAFAGFQKELGLRTDQKIWQFHFPAELIKTPAEEPGHCLTNNHITWRSFTPIAAANVATAGSYTYSLPPDSIRDQGGTTAISFAKGDLTDRRDAPTAGDVVSKKTDLQDWIVRYKRTDAFDIVVDLGELRDVNRVRLFYSGPLTSLSAAVSADAQAYSTVASETTVKAEPQDVADLSLVFDTVSTRYVKLSVPERAAPGLLVLAELEVWGP